MSRSRLIVALAALLALAGVVAVVVIATGGDDEQDPAALLRELAAQQQESAGEDAEESAEDGAAESEVDARAPEPDEVPEASVERIDPPKPVKGGDNSVQEFGEEASGEQAEEIVAAFGGFLQARADGDWDVACSLIQDSMYGFFSRLGDAAAAAAESEGEGSADGCAAYFERVAGQASQRQLRQAARVRIGSVRVEGQRGFVIYKSAVSNDWLTMPMIRERGRWRVGAIDAAPLR